MATGSQPIRKPASGLSAIWSSISPDLKRLILVGFVEITAVNFYTSVLMPYYRSLGYGSEVAGTLTSVLQIVGAAVGFAAGFLADTLGRKRMYVAGQLCRCAAAALLLTTRNYYGLVAVSVARGLSTIQQPAQSAIIASHTKRENRATLYGMTQTASQAASVVGPLAAGFIADAFGAPASFTIGLILAAFAIFIAMPVRDLPVNGTGTGGIAKVADNRLLSGSPPAATDGATQAPESAVRRVSRMFRENNPVALSSLLLASVTNGLANGATNILIPFFVMDRFSDAYSTVSGVVAASSLGTMAVLLLGGYIADARGRRGVVLISGAIFPIIMSGLFVVGTLWQFFAFMFLVTMTGNISSPAINAVHAEAVAECDRATFSGLHGSLNSAGLAVGSLLAGIAYEMSPTWPWIAVIILFATQLPCYALAIPKDTTD